jgi:TolB-like protein
MEAPADRADGTPLRIGAFVLEPQRCRLLAPDGRVLELRPKTTDLLRHLARNAGRVVPREELLDAVWPGLFVTDDSVTQCVLEARRAFGAEGAALLRTVPRRGYLLETEIAPARTEAGATPVLAVLPFDNLSREPRWDMLCDGLVEDLITDLARHPELRVIARTSSFAWRGKAADIREIGRALGAGYILEGSVQAEGGAVRVTAQLIEAEGGAHVWAQRYAREEAGLFAIQEEVVAQVVGAVGGFEGGVARAERARMQRAPPASLRAYELYLLGYEQEARLDREGTLRAIELLEQAVAADPSLARAWTTLGFALGNAAANGWAEDAGAARRRQAAAIRRAVALDPGDGMALEELGALLAREGDVPAATDAFRRAARAGANHADTLAVLAKYLVEVAGDGEAARRMTERAFLLNPHTPAWYYLGASRVAFFTRDFARVPGLVQRAPAVRLPQAVGALALAMLERHDEAATALAAHRTRFGADGVTAALAALRPLCAEAQAVLDEALAAAGLPR